MIRKSVMKTVLDLLIGSEGRYANLLLSSPTFGNVPREEKALLTALLYTTVENKLRYDYFISCISGRSSKDMDGYTLNILRLGMCQLLDMNGIPDFAAVNGAVALARNKGEKGFVNAVLRRVAREKDSLPYPDRKRSPKRYLSVKYSVPQATAAKFISIFGEEEAEKILASFSSPKEISVSVNTKLISVADFLKKHEDLSPVAGLFSPFSVKFPSSFVPTRLPGFSEGEFFVQNEASAIAVGVLGLKENDIVMDVCAAPGGKTLLAAISVGIEGRVYSYDLHESKLSLIKDSVKRLSLGNVQVASRDATEPDENLFGIADAVICDVPCSGFGVLGKKPDLRYKDVSVSEGLVPLQREILEKSVNYLKPGGVVVYSTCTLIPEENEGVTDEFIKSHPDFEYEPFAVGELSAPCGRITLLPTVHKTDGFYIAKIRKKK